jgi:hypothetical protein
VQNRSISRSLLLASTVLAMLAISPSIATAAGAPVTWSSPVSANDGGTQLNAVSCPSSSLCVLADNAGNIVTSTNPAGGSGTWTSTHIDGTTPLTGVSCPTTAWCVAVDNGGNVFVSNNPAAHQWSPSHNPTIPSTLPNSLSCAASAASMVCVAVDASGKIASVNQGPDGAWRSGEATGAPSFDTVSCVAIWLCVAGDSAGDVFSSKNPEQGPNWTKTTIDSGHPITAVWCSEAPLCVAGDNAGNVFTSTDANGVSWSSQGTVDSGHAITGASCRPGPVCVVVDGSGNAFTSTNPTGGAGGWSTPSNADPGHAFTGVSCGSGLLCAAIDNAGNVTIGATTSPPTDISPPSITGTALVGQRLTELNGSWTGDPSSYGYQWESCSRTGGSCTTIHGATSSTYTPRSADAGHTIRVQETATNAAGSSASPATSAPTAIVPTAPAGKSLPGVSGQLISGRKLHGTPGGWSGDTPMSYSYQWVSCRNKCTNIPGATGLTYKLRDRDQGSFIRLQVTATNRAGSAQSSSRPIGAVVTPRQLRRLILKAIVAHGRDGKIGAILRQGYVIRFSLPLAGKLRFSWKFGRLVVATGRLTFGRNSTPQLRLRLSGAGAQLFGSSAKLRLTAGFAFTPAGGGPITGRKRFLIRG